MFYQGCFHWLFTHWCKFLEWQKLQIVLSIICMFYLSIILLYVCFMSPHHVRYDIYVLCLHRTTSHKQWMLSTPLPPDRGSLQKGMFPFCSPTQLLAIFFSPHIILSLFQLRASTSRTEWDLIWFPELYLVSCLGSLSKNYCLLRGMFSSEVCSKWQWTRREVGSCL